MARNSTLVALALFAASASFEAAAREEPVKVNVEGLSPAVAAEVKKHAAEGITSLNRYLWNTQMKHGLTLADVTRPDSEPREPNPNPNKEYKKHAADWKK